MKYELASSSWDEKEIQAIQDVIKRDCYTMGNSVKQFEADCIPSKSFIVKKKWFANYINGT